MERLMLPFDKLTTQLPCASYPWKITDCQAMGECETICRTMLPLNELDLSIPQEITTF